MLRIRQQRIYTDLCSIYRRNKVKSANGDWTFSLLAANVVCKHYTHPNFDTDTIAGGIAQTKQGNIFTADSLHVDVAQDIQAEDWVLMTKSPNVLSNIVWFRVAGEPESRFGIANRSQVYLVPGEPPEIV